MATVLGPSSFFRFPFPLVRPLVRFIAAKIISTPFGLEGRYLCSDDSFFLFPFFFSPLGRSPLFPFPLPPSRGADRRGKQR